jgi:hypothetical protein
MFDVRTNLSNKVVETIKEKFHDKLFKSIIRESTQLAECPISSKPITRYAPGSRGTQDYMDLAREVIEGEKEVARYYEEDEAETSRHFDEESKEADQQNENGEDERYAELEEYERLSETGHYPDEGTEDVDRQNVNDENENGQRSSEVETEAGSQFDEEEKDVDQRFGEGEKEE